MPNRRGFRCFVAGLGLVLAAAGPARAESPDALYKRGVELRKSGQDDAAVEAFKKLNEIEQSPRNVAQLGLAEQAVGLWVDAEGHVQEALKSPANPWVKKNQDSLTTALARIKERLGWVEIRGEPAEAEVLIDGKPVGTLGAMRPIRVVVGSIPITVRAPDYLERSTVVTVAPNATVRERFVLARTPVRTPPASVHDAPEATGGAPAQMAEAQRSDSTREPSATPLRRSLKWVAFGLGAGALAVGVLGYARQSAAGNDFNASCGIDGATGLPAAEMGSGKTDQQCADLQSRTDSSFRLEAIGLSVAGTLAVAGLVLWLTEPSSRPESRTAYACAPALAGSASASLVCALRF